MGHQGLLLEVRCPSWTSPMPNGILKCQIGLFHSLKNAGYLKQHSCCGFWSYNVVFGQKKAMVTPTDDIVRPQRLCCITLMILEWLAPNIMPKEPSEQKTPPQPVQGVGDFFVVGRGMFGMLERDTEVPNAIQSPKLVDYDLTNDSRHLSSCQMTHVLNRLANQW